MINIGHLKIGTFLLLFVYFCFSEGQLLRPLVLFHIFYTLESVVYYLKALLHIRICTDLSNILDLTCG